MRKNYFENFSLGAEFVLIIIICLGSALVFSVLSMLLAIPIFGFEITELFNALGNATSDENLNFIKYTQTIQSIGIFIVPSLIVLYMYGGKFMHTSSLRKVEDSSVFLIVIFIAVFALPFINFIGEWNANLPFPDSFVRMEENAMILTEKLLQTNGIGGLLFNLFMIAVIPAIGEELLFRRVLQDYFVRVFKNAHIAILFTSILFSAMHVQPLGFFPRMILGMLFGYMYAYSGSILLPMFAHFMNNGMAVIVMFFIGKGNLSEEVETFGAEPSSWPAALISLALCVALFYLLKQRSDGSYFKTKADF